MKNGRFPQCQTYTQKIKLFQTVDQHAGGNHGAKHHKDSQM